MTSSPVPHGVHTCGPAAASLEPLVRMLAAALEGIAREAARDEAGRVVLAAASEGRPAGAEWLSQVAAARVAGVAPATVREWQRRGLLGRGRGGRVNAAQLDRLLRGEDQQPSGPVELDAHRRKRTAVATADSIRGGPPR